ncbi:MAG: urea transporter [Betaproteobacteria bacterium]|nr:urea transporter [Betaproteobacteria bacterium]
MRPGLTGSAPWAWMREAARAYASVLFCDSVALGAWFALVTFTAPRAAIVGAASLAAAMLWARLLGLAVAGNLHLTNSLLCGLYVGAFHALDAALAAWLVIASGAVTLLTQWLSALTWRLGKLPLLSLPFVLVSWITALAAQLNAPPGEAWSFFAAAQAGVFGAAVDGFFVALGWLLLVPHPVSGALVFLGLLAASRYLALLAIAGYAAGALTMAWFAQPGVELIGFNFMLAAMAVGGIFTLPGRVSFCVAIAAAVFSAWLGAAFGAVLGPLHLPLLTLPFVLSVYVWLGGLGSRETGRAPQLSLDAPSSPEAAYERARLARARGGVAGSLPVLPPFYGEWCVTQAFDGPHTHRAPWAHALDFSVPGETTPGSGSRKAGGNAVVLGDFPCYGAPLLSPISGQVVAVRDDLADVNPGGVDTENNWGNFVLVRVPGSQHVLLAHLKQASVLVKRGEWVSGGQPVAACGSSGRSPEPHLHLHVQATERLGSPTLPFHLANVLVRGAGSRREFRLYHLPSEGDLISPAPRDARLAAAMHLPAGCSLRYHVLQQGASKTQLHELRSELTLLGQPRLSGVEGASAAFEDTSAVLGFYDRQGPVDPLLDMWVLALGLTPYSAAAERWGDHPALRLLPLGPLRRMLAIALRPLGGGCDSAYTRRWDDTMHAWVQRGEHRLRLVTGIEWLATTAAWIEPAGGVRRIDLEMFGRRSTAQFAAAA